ncbi:MAG TPA: TetR/AcrR family transcriptional regulator [bacterium]|nr:TetR/AcrR family transcriptional regulator [bacterium]HPN44455.1 TetR/AcrR family transcriptional regulator [bacterium]
MNEKNEITANVKYQQIMNAAQQLFYKYGLRRVAIEEICETANVSKMTFYKFFQNKTDLIVKLLKALFEEGITDFNKIVTADIEFPDKVRLLIDMKRKQTEFMCLDLWHELVQNPLPEVKQLLDTQHEYFMKEFIDIFIQGQKDGDIRPDIKPEFINYMLNILFEAGKDKNLLKMYDSTGGVADEIIKFYFYGILARND